MATKDSTPKPKFKKCKVCSSSFQVMRSTQKVCSYDCAIELTRTNAAKKDKQDHAKAKRELKDNDRSFQLKKTQAIVNKYIRLRDCELACISCSHRGTAGGYIGSGGIHAGHYRSRGACPELRFEPLNIHAQCAQCNNIKSGNAIDYRIGLIKKIGIEKVEWIEGPHEAKRYTIPELKEIQAKYSKLTKELESKQ